jgi:ATP-dependent DNA helicase RecG
MVELSAITGISKRKILDNTNKLKQMGLLERVGNNKTGYWRLIKLIKQ